MHLFLQMFLQPTLNIQTQHLLYIIMFCPYYTYSTDLLWISDVLIVSERAIICLVVFLVQHIKKTVLLTKQAQNNLKFSTSCIPTSLLTTLPQTQRHYPFSSSCCTKLEVTFQIAVLKLYLAFSIFVKTL